MSPNTPTKQHHHLKIRPTYLGEYKTEFNKDNKTTVVTPVLDGKVITSRDGRTYKRTSAGNLVCC